MAAIEYLDPSIANEGTSANDWQPGVWANAPSGADEEYQPDIEPPHINDYAAFKKHKHYRQYFRPYRYIPFPAWMYHATQEPKLIEARHRDGTIDNEACKQQVIKLGPEWSPTPLKPRVDMTGKSLPVKSETQRLAEAVSMAAASKGGAIDPTAIAAIVAAVMSAMKPAEAPKPQEAKPAVDDSTERAALLELAEKEGITIEPDWANERIKEALGL